jgi:hypothetical protein
MYSSLQGKRCLVLVSLSGHPLTLVIQFFSPQRSQISHCLTLNSLPCSPPSFCHAQKCNSVVSVVSVLHLPVLWGSSSTGPDSSQSLCSVSALFRSEPVSVAFVDSRLSRPAFAPSLSQLSQFDLPVAFVDIQWSQLSLSFTSQCFGAPPQLVLTLLSHRALFALFHSKPVSMVFVDSRISRPTFAPSLSQLSQFLCLLDSSFYGTTRSLFFP